ncbi:MAG: DEAD/DEAH box helicase [Candidatus Omnitrophica bacterium]|nr:DEAD/DEAH box helicase [Candidatus Omnitrophota bacterium]
MLLPAVLKRYSFPEEIQNFFHQEGIHELYPPQAAAINAGVLDGKNLLLSVPTAAGKTLIAQLAILKSLLSGGKRCLYICPLKALANEKYQEFQKLTASLEISIGVATGDSTNRDDSLAQHQVIIGTAEKVDSLLRHRSPWLTQGLSVVIFDEIHFLDDGSRGPTLEILIARIRQLNPQIQIIALSATIQNSQEMADWLDAQLVTSTWRPVPLKEGVYFDDKIQFSQGGTRLITEGHGEEDLNKLCLDTMRQGGQLLVFVNSRRSTQAASLKLRSSISQLLNDDEKKQLVKISQKIIGTSAHATRICRQLGETVLYGVAFHHAGLKPHQRELVEESFKKNLIKVICATPTLAAGVNLPARRVIVRDVKRFEAQLGASYIPTSEYKQCAGRAGRPRYDPYGEAILMAKTSSQIRTLFDRYILADPEPVTSKLADPSALRVHILASIVGEYVHDINETLEFLSHTFLAHQRQTSHLLELISETFEFLEEEEFIRKNGFRFFATPFGQQTSRLYIDPLSAITLRDGLKKLSKQNDLSATAVLHWICCCRDAPLLKVGTKDLEIIEGFAQRTASELVLTPDDLPQLEDFFQSLAIMKTTMMLTTWIDEEREETICDYFNIGPGDVYRHTEAIRWLLYAAIVIADLFQQKKLNFILAKIKSRVQYGVKEELLPLVDIKGIGRVRARKLFEKGFRKLSDFKLIPAEQLAEVPLIGKNLALELIEQAHQGR